MVFWFFYVLRGFRVEGGLRCPVDLVVEVRELVDYVYCPVKAYLRRGLGVVEEVEDWREAVRLSGELLVKSGCVEPRYVEAMIRTCEELGPYIAVSPGVAIPHARPEEGAKAVCFSLLIVRKGVNFGSHNDPVYLLIAFASPDKTSHLKILQQLARLLMEKGSVLIERLRRVGSPEEASRILSGLVGEGERA